MSAMMSLTTQFLSIINFKLLTFMLKLKFWKIYVCYDELDNSIFKDFYGRKNNDITLQCVLYNKVDQYLENVHS